ncbi:5-formyltetrahydrofolate cyclo-ligase [Sporosarcina sp. YIM B06819]|uniref:5-formyltetrahydrofolate cyclo-ligase n=1 Tax=Sporosarcina sp. YIM B06819 TaxID=3081769 RepID=UPI00298C14BB|nr:5-formyltetrahydrofolate cyclo-ligase [Sporosarcina sp. YIM B06819]
MTKKDVRNQVLDLLNSMDREHHSKMSMAIINRVLLSDEFLRADMIGITLSHFPEVDTRPLIEAAWRAGKRIAVPKCIQATREMDFRVITSYTHLETVYMNLLEPIVEETVAVEKEAIDLQIVPGVVFSNEGYRIGFGGGYYDRYLADYNGRMLSLAFDCQMSQAVPIEGHDIPVHKIVTVDRVINCKENEV